MKSLCIGVGSRNQLQGQLLLLVFSIVGARYLPAQQVSAPGHVAADGEKSVASALAQLPVTFAGILPCADCPGIHYQLSLNADHTFASTMKYQQRDVSLNDSGHWELIGNVLVLHDARGATDKFAVRDADTLRKLNGDGNEIVSQFNYDLKREQASTPVEGSAASIAALERTHWRLNHLGDTDISVDAQQQEAYLVLDPNKHRVSGSGGCNRLMGSYEVNGEKLNFGQMAGTRMACVKGMESERAFLQALGQVSSWKITGQNLEFFDESGKTLARFDAQPAP
jgi:heat shock protein HslJ